MEKYTGPFPGDNCGFLYRGRSTVNGVVRAVNLTARGIRLTIRVDMIAWGLRTKHSRMPRFQDITVSHAAVQGWSYNNKIPLPVRQLSDKEPELHHMEEENLNSEWFTIGYGFKGDKKKVLAQLEAHIHEIQVNEYKYIRAWITFVCGNDTSETYVRAQQERALKDNAPLTATWQDWNGRWQTVGEVSDEATRQWLDKFVSEAQ